MTEPTRIEVVEAGHTGDEATARRGLEAADPVVRASALSALDRLGCLTPGALDAAIDDPSLVVRRKVAELAARHHEVGLGALLDDSAPEVAEMAAWAAGERESVPDADLERLLAMGARHRDPLVREAAVAALGAIGNDAAVPVIIGALADKPAIRRRAVIALTPFDGPEVREAFERARADRDWQVRQLADELSPDD